MNGFKTGYQILHLVRQSFIDRRHIGEGGVAAIFRDDLAAEKRRLGRAFAKGLIRVPDIGAMRRIAFLIVIDDQFGRIRRIGRKGMDRQIAPVPPEAFEIVRIYFLVRKDQHAIFGMRPDQTGHGFLIQRF